MEKSNVVWFEQCGKDAVDFVGGKNSSLGELINAGIRVPPGFAVTTTGYRNFMDRGGVEKKIFKMLADVDHDDMETLEALSTEVRQLIENTAFSIELEDDIAEMYRLLSQKCFLSATPVAVRSSATAEDLPDASFAGQQDTYLWIRGVDDVLDNVKRCFSSLYTARAIAYRAKMDFSHEEVNISVGIQKMANSHTAGVMFTLNPSTGDRSIIAINASFGFGEAVVSGEVTPDEFLVNKITLDTIKSTISTKSVYYGVDHKKHCTRLYDVPVERQNIQSIVDEEVGALAAMGKQIEKHYGKPMDIEWAVDADMPADSKVFILQARPETVWSNKQKTPVSNGKKRTATDHILAGILAGQQLK